MSRAAAGSLALAAWLAPADQALAANANLSVTVTPIPTASTNPPAGVVSVSRTPAPTNYIAYSVVVTNNEGNTSNQVTFTADTAVVGGDAGAVAGFYEKTPATAPCTGVAGGTHVVCNIGQMQAGATVSFVLIFKTPTNGASINLATVFGYSNGASPGTNQSFFCNGAPATPPCSFTIPTTLVTLDSASVNKGFQTYIPNTLPTGVNYFGFFTGVAGAPTSIDPWATELRAPGGKPTTVTVDESQAGGDVVCAGGFLCNISKVVLPGDVTYSDTSALKVLVRRSPDFIKPGTKLADLHVYGCPSTSTCALSSDFEQLDVAAKTCANAGVDAANPSFPVGYTLPYCFIGKKLYDKKDPSLPGVLEFQLLTRKDPSFRG